MSDVSTTMAKLSGIRKAIEAATKENVSRNRGAGEVKTRASFAPPDVEHYFDQADAQVKKLRQLLPDLYGDFQEIEVAPTSEVLIDPNGTVGKWFGRAQLERLIRDIDQIFEIRANSELSQPVPARPRRVFISHGRSNEWRVVQPYIEKDVGLHTLELAQEASKGRTVIEKLVDNSQRCDSAVIVMTGDDIADNSARVRENVMHEIGYFQGSFGRSAVVLLHEEGVSIPSNLSGIVYVPFPKGNIEAGFHVLQRELKAIYGL